MISITHPRYNHQRQVAEISAAWWAAEAGRRAATAGLKDADRKIRGFRAALTRRILEWLQCSGPGAVLSLSTEPENRESFEIVRNALYEGGVHDVELQTQLLPRGITTTVSLRGGHQTPATFSKAG